MSVDCNIRVRYQETDQMGVVYYGNYFTWFEVGRTELLRSTGSSYREMESNGVFLPVAEATCHYKSPARYDELLTIKTSISKLSVARIVFDYTIVGEDGRLVVEGSTTHAFVSSEGRPLNVAKKAPSMWELMNGLAQ